MKQIEYLTLTLPGYENPVEVPKGIPTGGFNNSGESSTAENILQTGISFLFVSLIILVFIYMVWGGIDWMFSHGDKGKVESARLKISWAIVGLIISFLAMLIVTLIGTVFGLDFFGFRNK